MKQSAFQQLLMDPPVNWFQPFLAAADDPVRHVVPGKYQSKTEPVFLLSG